MDNQASKPGGLRGGFQSQPKQESGKVNPPFNNIGVRIAGKTARTELSYIFVISLSNPLPDPATDQPFSQSKAYLALIVSTDNLLTCIVWKLQLLQLGSRKKMHRCLLFAQLVCQEHVLTTKQKRPVRGSERRLSVAGDNSIQKPTSVG